MKRSLQHLGLALPNARGGPINLGKKLSMAKESNWALTTPELFAASVRSWIKEESLSAEIEGLQG